MTRFPSMWIEELHPGPLRGAASRPLPAHVRAEILAALDEVRPAPPRGLPALREAIGRLHGRDPDIEVLVTSGAQHALSVCFRALVQPGESVIVPTPAYFFGGAIEAAGACAVYVASREKDGWRWDPEAIEAAVDARTRALVLCNPNNPTGYLPSADEIGALVELAERHGLLIVTDEAYERYLYDGARLASVLDRTPDAVLVRSIGKSYAMPGWRLGYLVAPPHALDACAEVLEWDLLRCPTVAQRAAAAAIEGPQDWLADLAQEYERKRDSALAAVEAAGLRRVRPSAGPFLFVGGVEDELLELGAVPGRFFQAPGYARLPFGGDPDVLAQSLSSSLR